MPIKILRKYPLRQSQSGYAAFAVTMIVMVVLSLIVLGFAATARREQTNALNDQLSTNAYYAAESGINDAYAVISGETARGAPIATEVKKCANTSDGTFSDLNNLDGSTTDKVSCLLVNPNPSSLEYRPLTAGKGEVMPLNGVTQSTAGSLVSSPVSSLKVSWQMHGLGSADATQCPTNNDASLHSGAFPPQTSYASACPGGVLQLDLVANTPSAMSNLTTANTTIYLQPVSNGGDNNASPVTFGNGNVLHVLCNATGGSQEYACNITLNLEGSNLPGSDSNGKYYLRITPIYQASEDVAITALDRNQKVIDLSGAQALIDSTGDANGVYKRIQERICISSVCGNNAPLNAVQSTGSICKDYATRPSATVDLFGCE